MPVYCLLTENVQEKFYQKRKFLFNSFLKGGRSKSHENFIHKIEEKLKKRVPSLINEKLKNYTQYSTDKGCVFKHDTCCNVFYNLLWEQI